MKVDIYVQRDSSALVVPSGCDLSQLPENVRAMTFPRKTEKKGGDLAQHLIALDDVEQVLAGIGKDGYYVNRHGTGERQLLKQLTESDAKTNFTNSARRVLDTEKVKKTNEQ